MRMNYIWKRTAKGYKQIPEPKLNPIALYSLFRKDLNTGKWIRCSDSAYTEALAYRVYRDRLSFAPLTYSIRPIVIVPLQAQGSRKDELSSKHYRQAHYR